MPILMCWSIIFAHFTTHRKDDFIMAVKTYSVKKDGSTKLSANFTVREFACKDGSDAVKIDLDNVAVLQKIRDHFGKSVHINSAYRTVAYNARIGGVKDSNHTKGMAADIVVSGVDPLKVYLYADSIGAGGVIYYPNSRFCHIDTRKPKVRLITLDKKTYYAEPTNSLKKGSIGGGVKWVQLMLKYAGYVLSADGKFGATTVAAVKDFQKKHGLTVDGSFGHKTKAKLKEALM